DAGIAAYVLVFLPAFGGIKDDVFAIEVAPDGRDLRPAIGHQCGETGEGTLLKKIAVFFGDDFGHENLLAVVQLKRQHIIDRCGAPGIYLPRAVRSGYSGRPKITSFPEDETA